MARRQLQHRAWQLMGTAILTVARPLQRFWDQARPTHGLLDACALGILHADGLHAEAGFLDKYRADLDAGNYWADEACKNFTHMYNPDTGRGLDPWPNAKETCQAYWTRALAAWRQGEFRCAMFYLGAACHIVQDLCVPHHAAVLPFSGHSAFEDLAASQFRRFRVTRGGVYNPGIDPGTWVEANARTASRYLELVIPPTGSDADLALADLLALAQRTTAGFLSEFLACATGSQTAGDVHALAAAPPAGPRAIAS